jgi:hypothetical protein
MTPKGPLHKQFLPNHCASWHETAYPGLPLMPLTRFSSVTFFELYFRVYRGGKSNNMTYQTANPTRCEKGKHPDLGRRWRLYISCFVFHHQNVTRSDTRKQASPIVIAPEILVRKRAPLCIPTMPRFSSEWKSEKRVKNVKFCFHILLFPKPKHVPTSSTKDKKWIRNPRIYL